ncbi:DNA polymerase III subunit beta [Candidatus Cytomitobacter primus]|uniref:Beta sliding clamp n=1 Tax=Candidatus Cytomitobacter primus TaxID=2066024 RepID=A0A5C0UFX6_9PROT|nr:DNA polymerase III subunit beta [Candidatus Cytomitobacter primus]QEK38581.1 DNA polymerase III subunit beta [Candidatus Cytomitobacter primus]
MSFKIKVKRTDFMEALRCQQSVIDRKATQPIFSHVKLTANKQNVGKNLNIEGSDGNLMLQYAINCEIIEEGIITLPGHILYNLVRKSNKEFISLECNEDIVTIDYGSGTFKLSVLDYESFPQIPQISENLAFHISALEFLDCIKMIKIAMANDEIRVHFNGIYIESDGNEIRFVATDGHRMAMFTKSSKFSEFNMILSRKSVETLCALITSEEEIKCYKENNQVRFTSKNFSFISRLVNGAFPANYKNLIPNSIDGIFQDSTDNLKESLDRISILSSQLSKIVTVKLSDQSTIKCDNLSYGSGEEVLSGTYQGSEFNFGIDCNIWLDFLRLFDDGNIKLEYHGQNKPILMRHENYANLLYIAMPIAIND